MSGPATQPTYEQLADLVADLGRQNLALRRRIEQLEAQLRSGPPPGRPPLPPFVKPVPAPKKNGPGPGRASEASAVITSVLRTARQQGQHLIETMKHLFRCHLSGTRG